MLPSCFDLPVQPCPQSAEAGRPNQGFPGVADRLIDYRRVGAGMLTIQSKEWVIVQYVLYPSCTVYG